MPRATRPPEVRLFVSYSHLNEALAHRFIDSLKAQTDAALNYEYQLWDDRQIVAGDDWLEEIERAIHDCDLGLLLISPRFLGSKFIKKYELSRFTGDDAKPVIPVILQPVDFRRHNSLGLERRQCFVLNQPKKKRSFAECTTENLRDKFALRLLIAIEDRLARMGRQPAPPGQP